VWVNVEVDGVVVDNMQTGAVSCNQPRYTLTSAFTVVQVAAGTHTIRFVPGNAPFGKYDSADRWNVTVTAYSR
jgi:hypothetical protein